ncbi:ISAzo13 family transposase [Rhodococcus koreensis]|nr:ISAzo13 family transposase [Rhodococcus koreensis]QSE82900.1 ISAzo13 family transposase [Rhodococcus koreensis]
MADAAEALGWRYETIRGHLNERQRRVWLGVEAAQLGPGGVAIVASATGVAADTVRRGRAEAEEVTSAVPVERSRKPGGGRKRAEAHEPELVATLEALIDPDTRGDPESPLRWTCKSTRALARALTENGYQVSDFVVRRLLKELGYSLQANAKTTEGRQHPDRDAQFRYLHERTEEHMASGDPVISVDTKKKELVGSYKNGGREWAAAGQPEHVKVHDFVDPALGKANPYGVYDLAADAGWVSVGTDHDTAAFAVATIGRWWDAVGSGTYPHAGRLLICADGGGSNGYRTRAWKTELAALAARTGLTITVSHLPPGTSKWNKIEHRLFSHISMNWRGRPLESHEVIVETIAATTTRTGLRVRAELDTAEYPTGVKIPDRDMAALTDTGTLTRHDFHGEWNYTLHPNPDTPEPD